MSNRQLIGAALAISLIVAVLISPFASQSPDGLEKVAQDQNFMEKAPDKPVFDHSLMPDYTVKSVKTESISTAVAGLLGTLLMFGIAYGFAKIISRKQSS